MKYKTSRGFTLIELLVVIAIIGILTTLITSNLTQAQARARDARRKTDLKVIAQGLEMYYSQFSTYPAGANSATAGSLALVAGSKLTDSGNTQTFIKTVPVDPSNTTNNEYYYCTLTSGSRITQFNLYAKLENSNDKEAYCGTAGWASTACELTSATCANGSAGSSGSSLSTVQGKVNYVVSDP